MSAIDDELQLMVLIWEWIPPGAFWMIGILMLMQHSSTSVIHANVKLHAMCCLGQHGETAAGDVTTAMCSLEDACIPVKQKPVASDVSIPSQCGVFS